MIEWLIEAGKEGAFVVPRRAIRLRVRNSFGNVTWQHGCRRLRGLHPEKFHGGIVKDRLGDRDGVLLCVLADVHLVRKNLGREFRDQDPLGIRPFNAIRIAEEADLPIRREHVKPLLNRLADWTWEEVVQPVACQRQVRQLADQRAEGLICVTARKETLEPETRVPGNDVSQLAHRPLKEAAAGFIR